jgi:hypothetical protein
VRRLALAAAVGFLVAGVANAGGDAKGEQRALAILATWGPEPWSPDDVRVAVEEADAFLRRSSLGQLSVRTTLTPWLVAYPGQPACPPPVHERLAPALADPPLAAARRAGFDPDAYERVIYVVPRMGCQWFGIGAGRDVMLNGSLSGWLVVHELGHTYGLAHADGDPFSPMAQTQRVIGESHVDFSAYEKHVLGWITDVARAERPGAYTIGRPDVLAAAPHALVVPTASTEYWLEQRLGLPDPGLAVRFLDADDPDDGLARSPRFVHGPVRLGRNTVAAGERFAVPGVFSVRYTPAADGRATLTFAWTDKVRPARPVLVAPRRRVVANRPFTVVWKPPREMGSGVASCSVKVDGRVAAREETGRSVTVAGVRRGRHRIAVSCTDRAGNTSRAAVRPIIATG